MRKPPVTLPHFTYCYGIQNCSSEPVLLQYWAVFFKNILKIQRSINLHLSLKNNYLFSSLVSTVTIE